jgi:hypothetical protein
MQSMRATSRVALTYLLLLFFFSFATARRLKIGDF